MGSKGGKHGNVALHLQGTSRWRSKRASNNKNKDNAEIPMRTITRLSHSYDGARDAVKALEDAGVLLSHQHHLKQGR